MKKENFIHTQRLLELERKLIEHIEEHFPFYDEGINYEYVHFNLESLLEVSQKCLFLEEDSLSNGMRIHIYNLLEIAKSMLSKDEYDFLNRLATYAQGYRKEKKMVKGK